MDGRFQAKLGLVLGFLGYLLVLIHYLLGFVDFKN